MDELRTLLDHMESAQQAIYETRIGALKSELATVRVAFLAIVMLDAALIGLGFALIWSRRDQDGVNALRTAERLQPDSSYAVSASDFLHPRFAPGLPTFVPSFEAPLAIRTLSPQRQVAVCRELTKR